VSFRLLHAFILRSLTTKRPLLFTLALLALLFSHPLLFLSPALFLSLSLATTLSSLYLFFSFSLLLFVPFETTVVRSLLPLECASRRPSNCFTFLGFEYRHLSSIPIASDRQLREPNSISSIHAFIRICRTLSIQFTRPFDDILRHDLPKGAI
jgi:hypothetical protein